MEKIITMEWLSEIGTFLLGLAAILTVIFGPGKYQASRLEIQREELRIKKSSQRRMHQFNIAKRAANLFGGVEPAFSVIRAPLVYGYEKKESKEYYLKQLKRDDVDGPEFSEMEKAALIHWRISNENDLFKSINELQSEFSALFGHKEIFFELWIIVNKVRNASRRVDYYRNNPPREDFERAEQKEQEKITSCNDDDSNDPTTLHINRVIEQILDICTPILRGEDDAEELNNPAELRRWFHFCK